MTNWDLFRLLCGLIASPDSHRGWWSGLAAEQRAALLQMAQQRQLLPALAMRLEREQLPPAVAREPLVQQLNKALLDNTRQKMQITAQALKLGRLLNAIGIAPLFLKGTALLLADVGQQPGFRQQVDIDVLIATPEIIPACQAMLADGYYFYLPAAAARQPPRILRDTGEALQLSRHHHHLLPLAKPGYSALVEIHKHHLPRRFQTHNPSQQVFDSARRHHSHGVDFMTPAGEQQIIQQILGSFVHDGYYPRFDFPVRTGHDYLSCLTVGDGGAATALDTGLIQQRCGKALAAFDGLARELMGITLAPADSAPDKLRRRLQMMQARMNSPRLGQWLDRQARLRHLGHSLWHNTGKLPNYLRRIQPGLA